MKKIYDIYDAAESLKPGKGYVAHDDVFTWESGVTAPTRSELDAEVLRLQAIEDGLEWSRNRSKEYPNVVDQLDDIYHNGIAAWKATIKATKDKYPKP